MQLALTSQHDQLRWSIDTCNHALQSCHAIGVGTGGRGQKLIIIKTNIATDEIIKLPFETWTEKHDISTNKRITTTDKNTVSQQRIRKTDRYLHKNVTLKSLIYVRRRRTTWRRRRTTSSNDIVTTSSRRRRTSSSRRRTNYWGVNLLTYVSK